MQDDDLPVLRGQGIQGQPECLLLLVLQMDAFRGPVVRDVRKRFLSGQPGLFAAVVQSQVFANPQQPVPEGGNILRQAQIGLHKGIRRNVLGRVHIGAEGQAVQTGSTVMPAVQCFQNFLFRDVQPPFTL